MTLAPPPGAVPESISPSDNTSLTDFMADDPFFEQLFRDIDGNNTVSARLCPADEQWQPDWMETDHSWTFD